MLARPRCGRRRRLLATINDPRVIRQILAHLGVSSEPLRPDPAQPPPARAPDLFADMPA